MKKMYGVNVPISCPFLPNGEVDYDGLRSLCDFLVEKGIHGLYPNGSTGEMCYLNLEERKKILEVTVETVNGRCGVFSMVGANSTRDSIELARHAEKAGADGIGIVTPYYFKLDEQELINFFCTVADAVSPDFPCYLYGIPQLAGNDISVDLAAKLYAMRPNIVGIKYSYPDSIKMLHFLDIGDGDFSVLTGPEELFYALLASGGDGVISGSSNVIPEQFVAIYDAFKRGDYSEAARLQAETNRILAVLNRHNHMAAYKIGLVERGIIKNKTMCKPLREMSEEEENALLSELKGLDYLKRAL